MGRPLGHIMSNRSRDLVPPRLEGTFSFRQAPEEHPVPLSREGTPYKKPYDRGTS